MYFQHNRPSTEYELAATPETGVKNWYQCVEKWHLE
jgi:hypothetical protein